MTIAIVASKVKIKSTMLPKKKAEKHLTKTYKVCVRYSKVGKKLKKS